MTATYRLQLHAGFTFADAAAQVDYLARLGVTHLYLSPVLQAVRGSPHGYDVVDHTRISAELGGRAGLERLAERARAVGLGLVVDVVPNHMAFTAPETANAPLWETLRDGPAAASAHWFDVDWPALDGRLGVPVLGGTVAETLAAGELVLADLDGRPVVRYHDHVFPVAPGTEGPDLRRVLERQHYLLASWRETDAVLNYRRFFDVTSLVAVRVELPDVFEATHRLLLELHHAGLVDGFRIDHPDGLADPTGYLQRLHDACRPGTPVYVEKILEGTERLPGDWPCAGTTGYDAAAAVALALAPAAPAALETLDSTWAATGGEPDLHRVVETAKRQVVATGLRPEARRLLVQAARALPGHDRDRLSAAVAELLVGGDVYRAYLRPPEPPAGADLDVLRRAGERAADARPDLADELRALVGLASGTQTAVDAAGRSAATDFAVRLQQTWGPVMAKAIEDTAFYRWHRLVALNEVGGDPGMLGSAGPDRLHDWAAHQQAAWPGGMTALSTHDTKRSEDVRARLLAVAADPAAWRRCSAVFAAAADDAGVDRPTAHLLWQTLVGAGPVTADRLRGYLTKAVREAKQHTTWTDPDAGYEAAVLALADRALAPGVLADAVAAAVAASRDAIRALVLGQKALQLLLPGVPDLYQGTELVSLALVDPDNRRPVDYAARRRRLDAGTAPPDLDQDKLRVVRACLAVRRELPDAFGPAGDYRPLAVPGGVGFVRGGRVAVVAQTADGARGAAAAGSTELPPGAWRDRLGGRRHGGVVAGGALFESAPVAVLVREGS